MPIYESLHVPKLIRKRSRGYELSVDKNFEGVIRGCRKQHGMNWLYPEVVKSFRMMFQTQTDKDFVTIHSVELWEGTNLVAGELGYVTCNSVYTSLTGFRVGKGSLGTIQLCVLGLHLASRGFAMWDLGMGMSYKSEMGAKNVSREVFVKSLRDARAREKKSSIDLSRTNARMIIDNITEKKKKKKKSETKIDLHALLNESDESKLKHLSKNQLKKLKKMQLKRKYKLEGTHKKSPRIQKKKKKKRRKSEELDTPRTAALVNATSDLFIAASTDLTPSNSTSGD